MVLVSAHQKRGFIRIFLWARAWQSEYEANTLSRSNQMNTITQSVQAQMAGGMFEITTREDGAARVIVMGKPSRKRAKTYVLIPLCQAIKEQLEQRIIGSLAMGGGALIEWALDELARQGITLEVRPET